MLPPDPPPQPGEGGSGPRPASASLVRVPGRGEGPGAPRVSARRLVITSLAALPWALVLFQFRLVLPRYDKLFRELGLKVDSLTQFFLDVSAWVRAHVPLAFVVTFALIGASVGLAYAVQAPGVSRERRLLVLLAVFAVPCALFVLSWVGVMGTHRTLVEGLKK
jgi:hypothetical protein